MKTLKKIDLDGTDDGTITISIIDEPYGAYTSSVASIGISLDSSADKPSWKVHIPKSNIDDVIEGLKEAKERLK